jgi:peptide/nickel transport system substrate-binding protein
MEAGRGVTLVKNPYYYIKGIPYLDKVIFRFIPTPARWLPQAGDVDVIAYDLVRKTLFFSNKIPGSRCSG